MHSIANLKPMIRTNRIINKTDKIMTENNMNNDSIDTAIVAMINRDIDQFNRSFSDAIDDRIVDKMRNVIAGQFQSQGFSPINNSQSVDNDSYDDGGFDNNYDDNQE